MAQVLNSDQKLKKILKEALSEAFRENRDLFRELFSEVMEDFALAEAIREGEGTGFASKEDVRRALGKKP